MSVVLPSLSVVIPVRDESPNVEPLARELEAALAPLPAWECLWVDDASRDDTRARIRALAAADPRHRALALPRPSGQTAALLAGWRRARHDFVGSLDGDRQNDPADLVRLLEHALDAGLDMVNGVRARRNDSWTRRVASRIANGFRNRVTGDHVTDVGCALRVFRRRYVESIPPLANMHRFLPTFVRLSGGAVGEAPVAHRARAAGRTKYGIHNRLWVGIHDTFGVRWMTRRWLTIVAEEVNEP